jgi:hypothetical protein
MRRLSAPAFALALLVTVASGGLWACTEIGDGFLQSNGAITVPDVSDTSVGDTTVDAADLTPDDTVPGDAGDTGPDAPPPPLVTWEDDIKPLFKTTGCSASFCHGSSKASGLSVASPADLIKGGKKGATIVPCNPNGGTLLDKLQAKPSFGKKMPLGGVTYTAAQRQLLIDWIAGGADQPGGCP